MRAKEVGLLFLLALPAAAQDDPVERALSAEVARAMSDLREPGYAPPYYVSLTAIDVDVAERRCPMGAKGFQARYEQRLVVPDVRVGDYALDNRPVASPSGYVGRPVSREDDEFALRHELWRLLDVSYKDASAAFLRKQALRVSRAKTEYDFDDLSREAPRRDKRAAGPSRWDVETLDRLCAKGGAVFRRSPRLLHAEASYRARRHRSRLVDSEGSRVDFGRETVELELEAVDISTDGLRLQAVRRFSAATPDALPSEAELERAAAEMTRELDDLKAAKSTSPISAPALIDPSVASALVLSIGMRLSGEEQRNPSGAQTFRDKLGKPVLPADFSLTDDPTRRAFEGRPLFGHYEFDDQGVPPQPVKLIEDGVLKGFLLSRYPVIGFPKSNGHGRAFPGYWPEAVPGNLFLTTKKPASEKDLLARLREETRRRGKRYGLWVRGLRSFAQQQGTAGHASIRVMAGRVELVDAETGERTLVRDLDLVGTPLVLLGNMLAGGGDPQARDLHYGAPISVITPSLLLSEVELQRAETRPEKAPILPPPTPPGARVPERRGTPFVPVVPHAQAMRYRIRGGASLAPGFAVPAAAGSRISIEGKDLIVDLKIVGGTISLFAEAARKAEEQVFQAARPLTVERSPLTDIMTASSYEKKHGKGLPR